MSGEVLYGQSLVLIMAALIAVCLLAAEAGFRLGRRERRALGETVGGHVSALQGALLGLLALLLGFTFAMAQSRFDARRLLVVDEANAIGTVLLRAQLVGAPEGPEIAARLRRYAAVRLAFHEVGVDAVRLQEVSRETDRMQRQLWELAARVAPREATVINGLFIESLNDAFDIAGKQAQAMRSHVPETVLWLLFFVASLAIGLTGYAAGLANRRSFWPTLATSVLIVAVIVVIMDLDRPRRGLVRVSAQSLVDLRDSLQRPAP